MKKILLSFILVFCTFVMVGCNKKVTVKFISSLDETIISEETVIIGETINAPTPKVYVGYKFSGWDKELASLKEDDIVYALYEKNIYTVIFKSSIDDLVIDTIEVEDGETATAPEIKDYEGYSFIGWDKDLSNIQEDLTINALYEKNSFIVSFKYLGSDGKENKLGDITFNKNQKVIPPSFNEQILTGKIVKEFDKDLSKVNSDTDIFVSFVDIELKDSMKLSNIYWWLNYIVAEDIDSITIEKEVGYSTTDYKFESLEDITQILKFVKNLQLTKTENQETVFGGEYCTVYFNIGDYFYSIYIGANNYSYGDVTFKVSDKITKYCVD